MRTACFSKRGSGGPVTVFASKRAAELAVDLRIDPASIRGSGRDGAVTVADVRAAAKALAPPVEFGVEGRKLWVAISAAVAEDCELDEREQAILALACRQADDLARLEQVIAAEGATTTGSTGQVVIHPALQEARQARQAIGRLLAALDLTEELGSRAAASTRGRRAAQARWADRGARGSSSERLFAV